MNIGTIEELLEVTHKTEEDFIIESEFVSYVKCLLPYIGIDVIDDSKVSIPETYSNNIYIHMISPLSKNDTDMYTISVLDYIGDDGKIKSKEDAINFYDYIRKIECKLSLYNKLKKGHKEENLEFTYDSDMLDMMIENDISEFKYEIREKENFDKKKQKELVDKRNGYISKNIGLVLRNINKDKKKKKK